MKNETLAYQFEPISKKSAFYRNFLIKNGAGKYVGIVHDMGDNDLHWYITKVNRKKGYLTNALKNTILPFLAKERNYQKISISKFETGAYYNDCKNIALNLGFKYNGKDEGGFEIFKKFLNARSTE